MALAAGIVAPAEFAALPWLAAPLHQALTQQRSHALLVQAAQGTGEFLFMLTLAKAWLCEGDPTQGPCGHCGSCHLVATRAHPDLWVLLPEARRAEIGWSPADESVQEPGNKLRKKPSKQVRIDEVRAAIDWIGQTMSRGRAKVLLVFPAEAMNLQAASAFLKTLEEPPGAARLLLGCSDAESLLPTVRSRCQRLLLALPSNEAAMAWLAGQGVAQADVLLAATAGAPLQALALANSGVDGGAWLALPGAVSRGQVGVFDGWPVPMVLDALFKLCHDAMAIAAGAQPRYFRPGSIPPGACLPALAAFSRTLARVARHDDHPWNESLLIEALVAEAAATWEIDTKAAAKPERALATLKR